MDVHCVFGALRLLILDEVPGMFGRHFCHQPVGLAPSASNQKADSVRRRQRPSHNGREFLADGNVLPVAWLLSSDVVGFCMDCRLDFGEFLRRVGVGFGGFVFSFVASGFALVPCAPAQNAAYEFVPLVGEFSLHVLEHQPPGELTRLFFDADHAFDDVEPVAGLQVPE